MSVSYDVFTQAFLRKVIEYDFLKLDQYDRDMTVNGYMKSACAQFSHVCKHKLTNGDDIIREFPVDVPEDEIDEIADIVSEGMVVEWLKPYVYRAENLENVLNTSDFTAYSPAELIYRLNNTFEAARKNFKNRVRAYSYNHGELDDLWL